MKTEHELEEFEEHVTSICNECVRQQLNGCCEGCIVDTLFENCRNEVYDNYEDRNRHD